METFENPESESGSSSLPEKKLYSSIMERVQAVMLDGVIILVVAFILFAGMDSIGMENSSLKAPLFLLLFLLYDPLMIAFSGGTIGHKMINLTVRKASDPTKKINIALAFLRFLVKSILGWVSLLTITGNAERRAIHDLVSNSVVLKKSPKPVVQTSE